MECAYTCEGCDKVLHSVEEAECHITICLEEMSERNEDYLDKAPEEATESQSAKDDCIEILISEVQCRQPLWNSRLDYKQRGLKITSVLWSEVDRILDKQPGTSQVKFKSLRDRFSKLLAESRKYKKSGSGADKQGSKAQWKFYEQLRFLIPSIEHRMTSTGLEKKDVAALGGGDTGSPVVNRKTSSLLMPDETVFTAASSKPFDETPSDQNKRKRSNPTTSPTVCIDPFKEYCKTQLEACNKIPDRISTFCMYLESELRELDNRTSNKLIIEIMRSLINAKEAAENEQSDPSGQF